MTNQKQKLNYDHALLSCVFFSTLDEQLIEKSKDKDLPDISLTISNISQIPLLFSDIFEAQPIFFIP